MADSRIKDWPTEKSVVKLTDYLAGDDSGESAGYKVQVENLLSPVIVSHAAQADGYALVAGDSVNGVAGSTKLFSGATNTLNVNTGLGTYDGNSPLVFSIVNNASGNLTVTGSATLHTPGSVPAAVVPYGHATVEQVATDTFILSGDLTPS